MERFENAIFKQREEIKDRMAEMFKLLKELTTSRAPKKVLIREEVESLVTKNVNFISLARGEEERNENNDMVADNVINRTDTEIPVKEVAKETDVENRNKNKPIKRAKREETTKASSFQPVGHYLKHRINEKLIEGLVDNHRGAIYEAILRKKIIRKEDIRGNIEIPCNIRGLKCINVLVDQGSDINVMPLPTYMKLNDERHAETDIRLSLASHSYIYPLGIVEDVLVDVPSAGNFSKKTKRKFLSEPGDGVRINPDGVMSPATGKFENFQVEKPILLEDKTNPKCRGIDEVSFSTLFRGTAANVQCYNRSEKSHYARNCPKPRNDFLFADASRMEEIEELSANICLMARIQPTNFDSDAGPSYDSAFLSEVQTPSTGYVNPLFAKDKQEQKYLKQPKIINNIICDDQIDSNIIFDEPNKDVNSGSVEYDNNV
ncbi:hypothetical protein Tco_1235986 [Tanacetum coccineum]